MTVKEHKKIVLVETNIFFSAKIVAQLKQLGYSVDTESSYQGVKDKAGLGISAIIIDLAARDINVLEMVKKLKDSPETASIPVIGFCGHSERALLESARSYGCDVVTTNSKITSDLPAVLDRIDVIGLKTRR